MTSKYLRYFLMTAVVFIWGVIVYRIVYGLGGAKGAAVRNATTTEPEMAIEVDSFTLNADYPDPFIPEEDTSTKADGKTGAVVAGGAGVPASGGPSGAGAAGMPAVPAITKETVAGIVQYKGYFGDPKKRNAIAIVVIHGKGAVVRERDKLEGITIKKIGREELQVVYKGQVWVVEKEQ